MLTRLTAIALLAGLLHLAACSDDTAGGSGGGAGAYGAGGDSALGGGGGSAAPALVAVEGDVLAFMSEVGGERIAGATVSILERPELSLVTGDDAHFRFEGLEAGTDVTLVVEHPDFKTTQTATVTLGPRRTRSRSRSCRRRSSRRSRRWCPCPSTRTSTA